MDAQEAVAVHRSRSGVICLFESRQDGLNTRQIVEACLGKRHGSFGSDEERDADPLFEEVDDPRRRRLPNTHLAPSDRKTPALATRAKSCNEKNLSFIQESHLTKSYFPSTANF
jgi:hypothetical protein